MKLARSLVGCLVLFLAFAPGSFADMTKNGVGEKLEYQSVIREVAAQQVADAQWENGCPYGELASGRQVWTKFDPLGLATEADYDDDIAAKEGQIRENRQANYKQEQKDIQGGMDSKAATSKFNAACDDDEKKIGYWIKKDQEAKSNIEETAKYANEQAGRQVYKASELDDELHPDWNYNHEDRSEGQQEYSVIRQRMDLWKNVGSMVGTMLMPGGEEKKAGEELFKDSESIADDIAGGHAYDKHVIKDGQYGDITKNEFADHIQAIIDKPTMSKALEDGRRAYYDAASGTVVIVNPRDADSGTTFIPKDGLDYFLHQLH